MRVRFGDCVLDTDRRELTRAGRAVPLQPKAFRLLELLVERWPRAVSQADLRGVLWPDTEAGGTRVARLVNEVRKAIADEARPHRLIRTVHRFLRRQPTVAGGLGGPGLGSRPPDSPSRRPVCS